MNKNISINELKKIINVSNVIDIRNIEKYNNSHIDGAINIPKSLLINNYSKYLNKNNIYYIYCQSGINSVYVCNFLSSLGYKTINVLGGYEAWRISCSK